MDRVNGNEQIFVENVDVVKVMLPPHLSLGSPGMDQRIEKAARDAMVKHFGPAVLARAKPIRVDVLDFAEHPPHRIIASRFLVKGELV